MLLLLGLKVATDEEKNKLIKKKKLTLSIETLYKGLPNEFITYINYTRSLKFDNRLDYVWLCCPPP
ncbi:unnamed protein product [Clonostachys chloroleuca]|uniref:Uncharacterized protein n=1 Tax=Clonostachys chloroleuca TaxID=1926264 RepID=A0AA35PUR9_9HYPO|nr:unnamed protein product [Clonostachys chloroleuca]